MTVISQPVRIQRSRARGWRMPEGAVYVGRPTVWGNPWRIGDVLPSGAIVDLPLAISLHTVYLATNPELVVRARAELAEAKTLACWCPAGRPCHADVLIAAMGGGSFMSVKPTSPTAPATPGTASPESDR